MIKNDFYPASITEANTGNVFTDQIQNLNIVAYSAAYWLGWIKPENIPSIYHLSKFIITDNAYIFEDVTKLDRNYDVGYISTYNELNRANYAILYPTNPVTGQVSPDYPRYINKLDVMGVGIHNTFQIDFRAAMYSGTAFVWRDMGFPINTMRELLDYLNGISDVTLTFLNQNNVSITKTFKLTDMIDGALEFEQSGTQYAITILGYHFGTPQRSINSYGNYGQYAAPTPAINIETTDGDQFISCPSIGPYTRANFQTSFRWNNNTWMDNYYNNIYFFGTYNYFCSGLAGEIPKTFTTESNHYGIFGNMLVINDAANYAFRITRIYTIDDIKHFMGLQIRIISDNASGYNTPFYGYQDDDGVNTIGTYTPVVTEDNEFTTEIKTGSLSDPDYKNSLRLWQWDVLEWEENDYTEDDRPPFDPGDDTADSGGDTIAPYDFINTPLSAANNFTTLYALTTAQVASFGAIMWASLSDPNFWHAVGVEFSNDFSINPADMMRYFNFLRYYPFDLTPYSSQYISGIYIGRSTIPIQFPTGMEYPRRALRNLIQIDGGEVTALLPSPYNSDDFFVSDPATQIQAHIPFCGSVQLSAAECYGRKLYLNYVVDLQSAAIQATISVQSDSYYIVATLAGTCGAGIQITANNNIEYLTRIATIATGGISNAATMAIKGAEIAGAEGAAAAGVVGALTGTVSALAGLPPVTVHKQGNTTGFANYGGDPRAYITIQAPKRSIPDTYAKSAGYVSNKRARIGDLTGYTEMINPDLSGIAAHQDELAEIYRILQAGFFA